MIIMRASTIPEGMTAQQCAAIAYGVERASRDLIVIIRTEDTLRDDPEVSQPEHGSLSAPADSQSVAAAPSKHQSPDYCGPTLQCVQNDAHRRGMTVTDMGNGFRLANKHGFLVRRTLVELVDFIRNADSGTTRFALREEAAIYE